MKKIMMTLATLFVAVCASAQVYIGGGVGFANTSYDHDSKFSWKIAPEIGFQLDKKWDAGISLGYSGVEDKEKVFEVAPYVRYTACSAKIVDFFIEGTIGYEHHDLQHSSSDYDVWEVGLKPGLKVNLSNHVAFVTKIGSLAISVLTRLIHGVLTWTAETFCSASTTSSNSKVLII